MVLMKHLKLYEEFKIELKKDDMTHLEIKRKEKVDFPNNFFFLSDEELEKMYGTSLDYISINMTPAYLVDFLINLEEYNVKFYSDSIEIFIDYRKYKIILVTENSNFNIFDISKYHVSSIMYKHIGRILQQREKENDDFIKILDKIFEYDPDYYNKFFKKYESIGSPYSTELVDHYKNSYLYQKYLFDEGKIKELLKLKICSELLSEHPEIKDVKKQTEWS